MGVTQDEMKKQELIGQEGREKVELLSHVKWKIREHTKGFRDSTCMFL